MSEHEQPPIEALLLVARKTREDVDDFVPMMMYAPVEGQGMNILMDEEGTMPELVKHTLFACRRLRGTADWVAITADTYAKKFERGEEPKSIEPGSLEREFKSGEPNIVEQMLVMLADREGSTTAIQTYRNIPSEGFEWDEPKIGDKELWKGEPHGSVALVVEAFFKAQDAFELFLQLDDIEGEIDGSV